MGLYFFFSGLGSFFGLLTLGISKHFIFSTNDIDDINCIKCHLNYYFFILGIIQIFGLICFIFIDRKFKLIFIK